jgi:DNA-binding response OmpR family regulator
MSHTGPQYTVNRHGAGVSAGIGGIRPVPQGWQMAGTARSKRAADIKVIIGSNTERAEPKLALVIRGQVVKVPQAQATVLACLHRHIGHVVPYETLCAEIGHQGAGKGQKHILRQYVAQVRRLLKRHQVSCAIATVDELGYALCQTLKGTKVSNRRS